MLILIKRLEGFTNSKIQNIFRQDSKPKEIILNYLHASLNWFLHLVGLLILTKGGRWLLTFVFFKILAIPLTFVFVILIIKMIIEFVFRSTLTSWEKRYLQSIDNTSESITLVSLSNSRQNSLQKAVGMALKMQTLLSRTTVKILNSIYFKMLIKIIF